MYQNNNYYLNVQNNYNVISTPTNDYLSQMYERSAIRQPLSTTFSQQTCNNLSLSPLLDTSYRNFNYSPYETISSGYNSFNSPVSTNQIPHYVQNSFSYTSTHSQGDSFNSQLTNSLYNDYEVNPVNQNSKRQRNDDIENIEKPKKKRHRTELLAKSDNYVTDDNLNSGFPWTNQQSHQQKSHNQNKSSAHCNSLSNLIDPIEYSNKQNDTLEQISDDDEFSTNKSEYGSINCSTNGEKKKRVLNKTQRLAANQRERKRMNIMNESFMNLRHVLPIATGRKRRKMSRLDIVIGAIEYISYLDSILNSTS